MRFSAVLNQVNYHRHFKRVWKRQSRLQTQELVIPPALLEMGVIIKDAKEILNETALVAPPPKKTGKTLPFPPSVLTREKCYYLMDERSKVSGNENQALALTKTVMYKGLPKCVTSLIGADSIPNQDELVQNSILSAQVFDGDQYKLPKIVDVTRPGWVFCRAYGIEYKKKVSGLLEKLSFLCEAATGKYSGCFQMSRILDASCEINIERMGDSVTFQLPCSILLTSQKPMTTFALPNEVAKTENEEVPDIYPIKPTLDLNKLKEPPTIRQSSEAQKKYGADVTVLPEPICVQCVYMDLKSFNFLTYQLNTLDLASNSGIKNQAWTDESAPLYDEVSEKDLIQNYNPQVFPKMLAFYMNGLHPS